MNNRRRLIVALGTAGSFSFAAVAQQLKKIPRISYLGTTTRQGEAPYLAELHAGLREYGYIEGKNVTIDYRWADSRYERLPELAAELAELKPDLIITHSAPGAQAARKATKTIPIVVTVVGDPIVSGLTVNLARPGGNVTGSSFFATELNVKRLEILRDARPQTRRVAVLRYPLAAPSVDERESDLAAKSLKLSLQYFDVRSPAEIESAFRVMRETGAEAVLARQSAALIMQSAHIARLATEARIPSVGFIELARAGGLLGYGVDLTVLFRRAAYFIDKVLKGTDPGVIPFERATRFEMVVNLKTAKLLGLTMPPTIMVRATSVIE